MAYHVVACGTWRRRARCARSEARTLLGVGENASVDGHPRRAPAADRQVHPDAGGSAGLATRVNAARDALIAELNSAPRSNE